jgi:hypothetical protein
MMIDKKKIAPASLWSGGGNGLKQCGRESPAAERKGTRQPVGEPNKAKVD